MGGLGNGGIKKSPELGGQKYLKNIPQGNEIKWVIKFTAARKSKNALLQSVSVPCRYDMSRMAGQFSG